MYNTCNNFVKIILVHRKLPDISFQTFHHYFDTLIYNSIKQ